MFDTRPLGFKEGSLETHWRSPRSIASWITLQKKKKVLHLRHGDHALQSCMLHVKFTSTGPRRPGMALVGARGAYYSLNHR